MQNIIHLKIPFRVKGIERYKERERERERVKGIEMEKK